MNFGMKHAPPRMSEIQYPYMKININKSNKVMLLLIAKAKTLKSLYEYEKMKGTTGKNPCMNRQTVHLYFIRTTVNADNL